MKVSETNKIRLFWLILGAILALCVGVLTYHPTEVKTTVKTVVKTDTITNVIERADTVLVYESKRYNVPVASDSINGEIDVVASGVDCSVDSVMWRLQIPTRTITNTITTEKVIKQKTHLNWGVTVGGGYGVINRKPDVFVGFGVMWSF